MPQQPSLDNDADIEQTAATAATRTPRPTKTRQIRTLTKKQFKIDAKEKGPLFWRLLIAPIYFLSCASTSLRQQATPISTSTSSSSSSSLAAVVGSAKTFPAEPFQWDTIVLPVDSNDRNSQQLRLVIGSNPSLLSSESSVSTFAEELSIALGWEATSDSDSDIDIGNENSTVITATSGSSNVNSSDSDNVASSTATWGANGVVKNERNANSRRISTDTNQNQNQITTEDPSSESDFRNKCNSFSTENGNPTATTTNVTTTTTTPSSTTNFLGCVYLAKGAPNWTYLWMPSAGLSLNSMLYTDSKNTNPRLLVESSQQGGSGSGDNDDDDDSTSNLLWNDPNTEYVVAVQNAIQNAILAMELGEDDSSSKSNSNSNSNSSMISYNYIQQQPIQVQDETYRIPSWWELMLPGLYANIGIIFMLSICVQRISEDVRIGLDRQFVLMGVPRTVYWFHYFVVYSIEGIVTALAFAGIAKGFMLQDVNFIFLVLNFVTAISAISALVVLIPSFVKQSDALQVVPLIWVFFSIAVWIPITYAVGGDPSHIVVTLFSLLNPIWGMQQLLAAFVSYGVTGLDIGVNSIGNWWQSGAGPCFVAQCGNILLYVGLLYLKNRPLRGIIPPASEEDKTDQQQQQQLQSKEPIEPVPFGSDVAFSVSGLTKEFVVNEAKDKNSKNTKMKAVDGFNMTVLKGEIYGFLGHNGAGKSTVLSLLAGEMLPTQGGAVFHFVDGNGDSKDLPLGQGHEDEIRSRLGFCPQHDLLFPNLSCRQHLELFAELKGGIKMSKEDESEKDAIRNEAERRLQEINFSGEGDEDKPVGTFSGGMKRKVSLSLALLGDPSVVFLDEPTSGMDPKNRRSVWEMIQKAKGDGQRSIVLTTHFMDEADILSDRIGIINRGKMVATGSSLFLKRRLGTGYHLTYDVATNKAMEVKSSIEKMIPSLEPASIFSSRSTNANATTATSTYQHQEKLQREVYKYHVPQGCEAKFSTLLLELSNQGCTGINMELTTLEDVFLKLGGENTSNNNGGEIDISEGESLQSHQGDRSSEENQEMEDIWGNLGEKTKPSVVQKVWIAAKVNALRKVRNKQFWVFVVLLPMIYGIVGFGLGYVFQKQAETVVSPTPIALSAATVAYSTRSLNSATVYGVSSPSVSVGEGVIWDEEAPTNPEDFLSPPSGTYYLGGPLSNDTLMYNASLTFSIPLLSGLLVNHTLAQVSPGSSVLGYLSPLNYTDKGLLGLSFILVPTLISFGFISATILVVDLALLKTQKMYGLFRSVGISQIQLHAGVALQNIGITILPFCAICIILAFALSSPLAGDGGRWLAFILTLIGYGYAITPFSMMFEPLFKSYKAAKDWWFLISMLVQLLPYVIYGSIFLPPMNPAKAEIAHVVSCVLCIFPTFAFMKNLGFLQLTSFITDEITWSYVWSWDAGVWFGIVMLFLMGTVFWAVVYWIALRKEVNPPGSLPPDVDITNDIDLVEERNRAVQQDTGIRIVDAVKHFAGKPSPRILPFDLNRSLKPTEEKLAVKGISIGVAPGELYCLIGPNGAGKTTLESCIMRDLFMDGGSISMGRRNTPNDVFVDADAGYCPQNDAMFDGLPVIDHIKFVAEARGLDSTGNDRHKLHIDTILRKLGLDAHLYKMAKSLSGGYKRKLCLAMALIGHPSVLIADEPSTGVDPVSRRNLWTVLKPSDEKRATLDMPATLISTHYMEEGENLATRIGIQIDGQLVTSGSLNRLKEKFCQANFLEATFRRDAPRDAEESLVAFLKQQEGLNPQLQESLIGRVKVQFPVQSQHSIAQLASLFDLIETNKATLHIEFYHLCSQSLEQIFIDLCKKQEQKVNAVVEENIA